MLARISLTPSVMTVKRGMGDWLLMLSVLLPDPSFRGAKRTRNLEIPRCAIAHLRFDASHRPGMTTLLSVTDTEFPLWLTPSQRPKSRARRTNHGRHRPHITPSDADHPGARILRGPARPAAATLFGRVQYLCLVRRRAVAHGPLWAREPWRDGSRAAARQAY